MKRKINTLAMILLFFLLGIIILGFVLAGDGQGTKLHKGKNYLEINQTIYINELVSLNPDIESVSYFNKFLNKDIGYVNVFGGVGSNFLTKQGQIYEISVNKNMSLIYPIQWEIY